MMKCDSSIIRLNLEHQEDCFVGIANKKLFTPKFTSPNLMPYL